MYIITLLQSNLIWYSRSRYVGISFRFKDFFAFRVLQKQVQKHTPSTSQFFWVYNVVNFMRWNPFLRPSGAATQAALGTYCPLNVEVVEFSHPERNSMVPNGQVRKGNFHKRARFFPQKVNYIIILGAWWDWIVKTPLDQIILPIKTSKLTLLVSENDHLLKVLAMNFWEKNPPATLLHTKSHATPLDRGWCSWRFATRWYRV